MRGEGRVAFLNLHHKAPDKLSPGIRARMGRTDDLLLRKALDDAAMLRIAFDKMAEPFDAVLTPAATGVAPEGLAYAGDPIFNGMWTLLHVPCLSMPVMIGRTRPADRPAACRAALRRRARHRGGARHSSRMLGR